MKKSLAFAKEHLDLEGNPKILGESLMKDSLKKFNDMRRDLKGGMMMAKAAKATNKRD